MAAETTGAAGPGRGGRMSRRRKRDAVLRLLRGEDLETVSRALGVTAATLTAWRDAFLAAGEASLATLERHTAKRFFKRLLAGLRFRPRRIVTDRLRSYGAARRCTARSPARGAAPSQPL